MKRILLLLCCCCGLLYAEDISFGYEKYREPGSIDISKGILFGNESSYKKPGYYGVGDHFVYTVGVGEVVSEDATGGLYVEKKGVYKVLLYTYYSVFYEKDKDVVLSVRRTSSENSVGEFLYVDIIYGDTENLKWLSDGIKTRLVYNDGEPKKSSDNVKIKSTVYL